MNENFLPISHMRCFLIIKKMKNLSFYNYCGKRSEWVDHISKRIKISKLIKNSLKFHDEMNCLESLIIFKIPSLSCCLSERYEMWSSSETIVWLFLYFCLCSTFNHKSSNETATTKKKFKSSRVLVALIWLLLSSHPFRIVYIKKFLCNISRRKSVIFIILWKIFLMCDERRRSGKNKIYIKLNWRWKK